MKSLKVRKLHLVDPSQKNQTPQVDPDLGSLHPMLPKPPFRMLFNGPSGSGKSSTFKCMLFDHYSGLFTNIFVFCPTFYNDQTLKDLVCYKRIVEKDKKGAKTERFEISENSPLKEEDVITESDKDLITVILKEKWDQCKEESTTDPFIKSLFIFDDLSIELAESKELGNYFTKGRKYNISIILMSNKYRTYPRVVRNNCTHFAFFKPTTQDELQAILGDISGTHSKAEMMALMGQVFKASGDFLFVDMAANEQKKYRRNFDQFLTFA